MKRGLANLRRTSLSAAAAFGLSSGSTAAPEGLRARIDPLVRPFVEQGVAVGLVVGVFRDGQSEVFGYGETVRGSGHAPGADTLYEIGSITKVFTSLALAEAVERGSLSLEDPLPKHLPDSVSVPTMGSPITLAHLAEHTSGLPRLPEGFDPADPENPYADFDVAKLYASLQRVRLARAPGDYEYSNYGAGLLGHVLERQANLPYERLVVDRVLEPLGMADTRIDLGPDQRRRLAPPYGADLALSRNWDLAALAGAGALRSTCRDLLSFVEANLNPPRSPLGRALERAARERKPIGGGQSVGLGWHIAGDHLTRWHDGGTGGYHSWLAIVPSLRLGVVVLANTATDRISQLGELLTRAAAGQEVKPMDLAARTEIQLDPQILARYVGFYALTPEFGLEVTVEGERLMVQATGQEKLPVYASGPGEFFYKVVDARLSFLPAAEGSVDRVVLHQGGQHIEGKRTR